MSWIGKVVGGVIGAAIAGPAGAVIGAGLGHGADALVGGDDSQGGGSPDNQDRSAGHQSPAFKELAVEAQYEDDALGLGLLFKITSWIPAGSVAMLEVFDRYETQLNGEASPFKGEGGDFRLFSDIDEGVSRFYMPYGALRYPSAADYNFVISVLADPGTPQVRHFGAAIFKVPLPDPRRWSRVQWLKPLIQLCMSVVNADGKVLPEEVRTVRAYMENIFEMQAGDNDELRSVMKAGRTGSIEKVVNQVLFRMPGLPPVGLLEVLADIAQCDNEVHPTEVEVIKRVALELGMDPSMWNEIAVHLGLMGDNSTPSRAAGSVALSAAYEVLGVEPGAPRAEIQAAYRKLVSDYHPDRVATMPEEFQTVAHQKMTEINGAFDVIKGHRSSVAP